MKRIIMSSCAALLVCFADFSIAMENIELNKLEFQSPFSPIRAKKNCCLANSFHPKTKIPFNRKGYPEFTSLCDIFLPLNIILTWNIKTHFSYATGILRSKIIMGGIDGSLFSKSQIAAIFDKMDNIPGLTWHHSQNFGLIQLVNRNVHCKTGHDGGMKIWLAGMSDKEANEICCRYYEWFQSNYSKLAWNTTSGPENSVNH